MLIFFSSFIEILKPNVMKPFVTLHLIERLKLETELIIECNNRIEHLENRIKSQDKGDPILAFLFTSRQDYLNQIEVKKNTKKRLQTWYFDTLSKLIQTNKTL